MKQQHIRILSGIFILLFIIATYPYWKTYFSFLNKPAVVSELELKGFTFDTTNKVSLKHGGEEILLSKKADGWQVASYTANIVQVKDFFSSLKDTEVISLVSKNPENQKEYEVSSDSGTLVMLSGQKGDKSIIVGKEGSQLNSFYVRAINSFSVYWVKGSLFQKVTQTTSDWRDKTVLTLDKSKIRKIVVDGVKQFTLTGADSNWKVAVLSQEKEIPASQSAAFLDSLTNIQASGFTDEKEKQEFIQSTKTSVTVFGDKEEKIVQILMVMKDSNIWVQVSGNTEVYKVVASNLAPILNGSESLK